MGEQRLFFAGKELQGGRDISDYGVQDQSAFQLFGREQIVDRETTRRAVREVREGWWWPALRADGADDASLSASARDDDLLAHDDDARAPSASPLDEAELSVLLLDSVHWPTLPEVLVCAACGEARPADASGAPQKKKGDGRRCETYTAAGRPVRRGRSPSASAPPIDDGEVDDDDDDVLSAEQRASVLSPTVCTLEQLVALGWTPRQPGRGSNDRGQKDDDDPRSLAVALVNCGIL